MQDERSKLGGKITISSVHTVRWTTCRRQSLHEHERRCGHEESYYKAAGAGDSNAVPCSRPHPRLNHQLRTYIGIGTANGGTSAGSFATSSTTASGKIRWSWAS